MAEISDFDSTDANNTARWPENMQFRNVNNAGRADEGILARWFKDTNASLTTSGSSNAYTVTANRTVTYVDSLLIAFTANHTNTGASTLNVSGLGAKAIKRPNGDALQAGDLTSGQKYWVVFVLSADAFQLLTMPAVATSITLAVGAIMAWPTENIPAGALLCDGSAVSRTTYAALFTAISTRYGAGDGSTTFNLPNYKDYFLRGHDAAGTDAGSRTDRGDGTTGANVGTKQASATLSHTHTGTTGNDSPDHTHDYNSYTATAAAQSGGSFTSLINAGSLTSAGASVRHTHPFTTAAAGASSNETRAKNITVNWIIIASQVAASVLATSGIGRNEEWIGARSMTARATSGAASGTRDSGAADITQPVFDFDQTTQEYVHFEWVPPKRWNKGTVSFIPYWTADAGTPAETFVATLAGVAISNDDALNATMGTVQSSSDVLIATADLHIGPESAAITIAGTPANADLVAFEVSRAVASDNLAGDVRLLGIKLIWTSNATSDD